MGSILVQARPGSWSSRLSQDVRGNSQFLSKTWNGEWDIGVNVAMVVPPPPPHVGYGVNPSFVQDVQEMERQRNGRDGNGVQGQDRGGHGRSCESIAQEEYRLIQEIGFGGFGVNPSFVQEVQERGGHESGSEGTSGGYGTVGPSFGHEAQHRSHTTQNNITE
ncbi:unnamed protein product [Camellia sinensis]